MICHFYLDICGDHLRLQRPSTAMCFWMMGWVYLGQEQWNPSRSHLPPLSADTAVYQRSEDECEVWWVQQSHWLTTDQRSCCMLRKQLSAVDKPLHKADCCTGRRQQAQDSRGQNGVQVRKSDTAAAQKTTMLLFATQQIAFVSGWSLGYNKG